ncbi:outer membrane beta-barrel family protein [Chitinophaga polysaccharea]|uniref:outer membrane beta-barrel family protein n=1 Tax=Chitinophaga polysaccharea TaxID=1293035 RepID=UPI00115ABE26|nr:outer membrane beta-barrel family protein [Chitinophaga polysaccharea]
MKILVRLFYVNSLIFFFSFTVAYAQHTCALSGVVKSLEQPIAYAEACLMKHDSILVKCSYTDTTGTFLLNADTGSYKLVIRSMGKILHTQQLKLSQDERMGTIHLNLSKDLEAIVVTGNKSLIQRKVDRLVFNLEHSIASKGTDLTQSLALVPMLRVSESGVSIIGKSGVSIMVNEKILNISGEDLMNYLRSIRSDDVTKVEVITTPPAKYEAEGNSGMINIVLKRNPNLGWSGNVSTSYAQTTYPGINNTATINYQSKKLNTTLRLKQYDRSVYATEDIDVIGKNSILSNDSRKDTYKGVGGNLGMDYKINTGSTIGFIYDVSEIRTNMDINNTTEYLTQNIADSVLTTFSQHRNKTLAHTLNAYYEQKLNKKGGKLNLGFNYFSNTPETNVDFKTASDKSTLLDTVNNYSHVKYRITSGQADLTLPASWATTETGIKFTNIDNNSDVRYATLVNGGYKPDPIRSNLFNYSEKNLAAYLILHKSVMEKWTMQVGLRYEYSWVNGYSLSTASRSKSEYGKWFPSVYLSYVADQNNTFSISYSKRINRPNFRAVDPFKWYTNPNSYYTGNPLLQPSFNHNIELSYLYKGMLSFTLYGQQQVNGFGRLTEVTDALKVVNYKNYLTKYDAGLNTGLSFKPLKWWENNTSVTVYYSDSKSAIPEVVPQQGLAFYYSINNTFTITRTVSCFVNFWHELANRQNNYYSNQLYGLSSGMRVSMLHNRLQVTASGDDLLKGLVSRGEVYYTNYTQTYHNYYDARKFTLSLTYTFGNNNVKGNRKQINFSEKDRAN